MADAELARQEQQVSDLRAQGRAAKIDVDHRAAVALQGSDKAVVYDEYVNRSVFVELASGKELRPIKAPETEKISFELQYVGGTWKVIDGTQQN
jgi:hypothetical protein